MSRKEVTIVKGMRKGMVAFQGPTGRLTAYNHSIKHSTRIAKLLTSILSADLTPYERHMLANWLQDVTPADMFEE